MPPPNPVVPGATYFITRRCAQRYFRLRPSKLTSQVFLYALALAAEKTNVAIHASCVMSNHHHAVVTDTDGQLPVFLRELHRTVSKVLNVAQGEQESLWRSGHGHRSIIVDERALMERIAYTVTNPVTAGLVARPEDWPGVVLWKPCEIDIERPDVYFDKEGDCPEVVRLRIVRPPRLSMQPCEWSSKLDNAIWSRTMAAHRTMRRDGERFIGRAAVLAQPTTKRAESFEQKRKPLSVIAASNLEGSQRGEAAVKAFRVSHHESRLSWRAGDHTVQFPSGTWAMRQHYGAPIAPGDWPALRIAA